MGFWDAQLTALEALGITFSPLYERALEEGGQVLALRPLPVPDSTPEYSEDCYDQHNQPVFVIEKIRALAPRLRNPYMPEEIRTIEAYADREFDGWRDYPSFVGYLEDEDRYCWGYPCECYRADTLCYYRFWDCDPLVDERIYETLARACCDRIDASLYHEIAQVAEVEYGDDEPGLDIAWLWKSRNEPEALDSEQAQAVKDWVFHAEKDEDEIVRILKGYERVVEAEYLPPPWHVWSKDSPWEGKHFEIPPMEEFVKDPLALYQWQTMLAQRDVALAQIRSIMTPQEVAAFEWREGRHY